MALPIPQCVNSLLFVDFIQMDLSNNVDYIMTIVDALSRFSIFVPCNKHITGEKVFHLIVSEWISRFGKPSEIISDNDVRFVSEKGFYQRAFNTLGIKVSFSIPYPPQSNGLCERTNRSFLQNLRVLSHELKSVDWPPLVPFVTYVMNSQVSKKTGFSPSELFLGRPSFKFDFIPDPEISPSVKDWMETQILAQEKACHLLEKKRASSLRRQNKTRKVHQYIVDDYVLVHKNRFPQRNL